MKVFLSVLVCKSITILCKIFKKNGTVFPGSIVIDLIDKNILNKIKYPKYVIVVTGSSGKGSTTNKIANILNELEYSYVYNESGSNGLLAAVTMILKNTTLSGKFKKDILLFECDERHLKLIFNKNQITHLIITNITRDQPSRNGHPNIVFNDIKKAITKDTNLIINADDPLINTLKYEFSNVTTFGIDKYEESYNTININAVDFQYCPICNKKLKYDYYHYGHIGSYHCNNCNFKRNKPNYLVTDLDLKKETMKINNNIINLDKNILYAAYYTVAAYALCHEIKIKKNKIIKIINNQKTSKRGKIYKFDNRELMMLETKNENALSYYQSLKYISEQKEKKTIIIGFDNVSRRYKYNDLSWLYDVEFEFLNDNFIDKILLIGRFKYDVATRLEYTNINNNKIIIVEELNNLKDYLNNTKGKIYTMVCFDMTDDIKRIIEVKE